MIILLIIMIDSCENLYNLISNLPQQPQQVQSMMFLAARISEIIEVIKIVKSQNRQQDFTKKCHKNQRLIFVSKVLREQFFKAYAIPETTELDYAPSLYKNGSSSVMEKDRQSIVMIVMPHTLQSVHSQERQKTMSKSQYRLRVLLISMFSHMLINEKMISFIAALTVPLYVYMELLRSYLLFPKQYLRFRLTEKCLKFIYQLIKNSRDSTPKIFVHLIKHFLQHYDRNNATDMKESQRKQERVKYCYSYIFEIAVLVLKKNVFLAAQCGILSLLYHKCIEGKISLRKVGIITECIIAYCVEEKSRSIIHHTIHLGKTFAIFTNVDMVQSTHEKGDGSRSGLKNKEAIECCAFMIELYLSNWPTLIYLLQERRTLTNFIISLKRKSEEQLRLVDRLIFKKIMMRCINYNRRKIVKSNNIFNIESNYLILKSLLVLNFLYKQLEFQDLIYSNTLVVQFKEHFIEILLEYLISREDEFKNKDINKLLINNIKNVKYYKMVAPHSSQQNEMINNNIESYCSESLLHYEYNQQELKHYLIRIIDIVQDDMLKQAASKHLLRVSSFQQEQFEKEKMHLLLRFYQISLECCKEIKWLHEYLDISKYLSSIIEFLRKSKQEVSKINEMCRNYLQCIFEDDQYRYFQFLNINLLDDIGRFFYLDCQIIDDVKGYISNIDFAYRISRILLHIDFERNATHSVKGSEEFYTQISRNGSKALILQVIEIIKFSCEQNENHFLSEHMLIIFSLIYSEDEDIVYSIVELLEEFVNKTRELESRIVAIDVKKINHLHTRILYLFLHYGSAIVLIEGNNPVFLKEELQKWVAGENRKKVYYNFIAKELKKFAEDCIQTNDYLNLNFDPTNYHKLIFLPWNIKINDQYYPIFIEYKNLQDKLKLKIYLNLVIQKQILIDELYIGSHNYTKYILTKKVFGKEEEDLRIRLTEKDIKKQHSIKSNAAGVELQKFVMQREETIFFINFEGGVYKIERININIPLTLDTYRPLAHPDNFINLLCRTAYGFEFLKKERFIEHCLQIIKDADGQVKNKEELRGALVCLGTICGSQQMKMSQKCEIFDLINRKFVSSKNYEVQEICLWILNILIKNKPIRSRVKDNLTMIETKKCNWICIPNLDRLNAETYSRNDRIANNLKYIRQNLPEKTNDRIYGYLSNLLNENQDYKLVDTESLENIEEKLAEGAVSGKVLENVIKYVSIIDFDPKKIYQTLHKLYNYILSDKFDADFPNGLLLP